jgi:hypothetical protein
MELKVFVVWDPRDSIVWEVYRHSILTNTVA